jgi:hypothetical protein
LQQNHGSNVTVEDENGTENMPIMAHEKVD